MINNDYKIIWQKWVDPFGEETDEAKWTDYNNEIVDSSFLYENIEDESNIKKQNNSIRVIATPMGLIPYNEHTASGKIFNFWTGHTNFTITKEISDIIEDCDGVEILDIFTRYRFRIAIGKCFDDSEVMSSINRTTSDYLLNEANTK